MWTFERTSDSDRKQQNKKGWRGGAGLDLKWVKWQYFSATLGAGLQTWRGCYEKAIERIPVLQVGLDKCDASVDWQIQFAQLHCRQGPS